MTQINLMLCKLAFAITFWLLLAMFGAVRLLTCASTAPMQSSHTQHTPATTAVVCTGDGELRLEGGEMADEYAYGRLEVFRQRLWSDVCGTEKFTPDSAGVACRQLGYDGGAALQFPRPYEFGTFVPPNLVRSPCFLSSCLPAVRRGCHLRLCLGGTASAGSE